MRRVAVCMNGVDVVKVDRNIETDDQIDGQRKETDRKKTKTKTDSQRDR